MTTTSRILTIVWRDRHCVFGIEHIQPNYACSEYSYHCCRNCHVLLPEAQMEPLHLKPKRQTHLSLKAELLKITG